MKQLLQNIKQISIFFLAISIIGCSDDDDGRLPEIIPGYTQTVNQDSGTVTFINISENGSSYLWDFGDGTTSTEVNPIKTFPAGQYTVILTVTNAAGATETFEDTFTIPGEPVAPEPGALALPITFDDATVTYEATTFNGVVFEIVDNPDASGTNSEVSKVGAITNVGAEFEGLFFDLTTAIDLTADKTITMNFWADAAVAILMKLEEGTADPIEASASHGGTGWESIAFTFSSEDQYSRLTIFVDGPGMTAGTFYIDDIMGAMVSDCVAETTENIDPAAGNLNWTFQTNDEAHTFAAFGNTAGTIVDNPVTDGINTSCNVEQFVKAEGCETFAGLGTELATALDFATITNKIFTMKVLAETQVTDVTLRLERLPFPDVDPAQDRVATITEVGVWQELTFDFSDVSTGTFKSMIIYFERDANCDGDIYYFDDIIQTGGGDDPGQGAISDPCVGTLIQDFEAADNSIFGDFGGGTGLVVDNPNTTVNTSAKVGQMQKFAAEVFGGTTLALATAVDFSSGETFTMDVFSQRAAALTFKLEGLNIEQVITTAGTGWETMTFDFTGITTGAAVMGVTLIFDNGTNGDAAGSPDDWTFLFDNLRLCDSDITGGVDNLITNGGFETGDDSGWETAIAGNSGTFAVTDAVSKCDTYSANIAVSSSQLQIIRQANIGVGVVAPNSEITISFDLRGTAGPGGEFIPILFSESTTDGVTKTDLLDGPIAPVDTWTRYTFTTTTGPDVSNGVSLLLQAVCGAVDGCSVDVYLDNVFIALGGDGGPECDSGGPVGDTQAPVILLNGNATVNLTVGASYTDAGATANDNVDGDISANIAVGGDTVDANTAGTYTITYNVSDAAGNPAAQVTRTVNVSDGSTFDDGLLTNGDFEGGATPWTIGVGTDPVPVVTENGNSFYSVDVAVAGNPFDVNMSQKLEIIQDATYTLTFDAWSDRARTIVAGIGLSGGDFANVNEVVGITADRQTYSFVFTATGFGAADARVLFDSGAEVGLVNIDNVSLFIAAGDFQAPVISLNGDATVNLEIGASYTDAGATANDNVDGDVSGNIVVGGDTVDTNTEGAYTITYNVSDAAGNAAEQVSRRVLVGDVANDLAENGDFETGNLDGWAVITNGGTITADNTDPSSGTWSAQIVASETGLNPTLKQERQGAGTISFGDTVQITFDYMGSSSGPGGVDIRSFVETTEGSNLPVNQTEIFSVTPAGTWQTFTTSFIVANPGQSNDVGGGITLQFTAVCGGVPGCSSILSVDNVSIVINP